MRLFRFGERDQEKPAVLLSDARGLDVSAFDEDWNERFFATDGCSRLRLWLSHHAETCPGVPPGVRFGPCVARPSKIICIGLNYAAHAAESGMDAPKEPTVFFKASSALSGPNDDVIVPPGAQKTDWEVELAVVVGKKASYVTPDLAMDYVAGYCLHNDYSERSFQLERGGQWVKGKSCDTFAPLGPYLVTADEITDPGNLRLWLKVNGELMQDSFTSDLIFDIPYLISYLSGFMTLLPGDVVSTGTPAGVGLGQKPPRYLKHGDHVECGIENLGSASQHIVDYCH